MSRDEQQVPQKAGARNAGGDLQVKSIPTSDFELPDTSKEAETAAGREATEQPSQS